MLHLAMHTAIVIVLAVTVTVVNNTRVTAVGVTMVVKKMEEYWCIFHGEVMNSTAILQDEYWFSSSRAAVGTGVLVSLTGECVVAGTEGGSGEPCLLLLLRIVVGLELTATS